MNYDELKELCEEYNVELPSQKNKRKIQEASHLLIKYQILNELQKYDEKTKSNSYKIKTINDTLGTFLPKSRDVVDT